ncbi:MAG: sulfatase-like hydrolase/transferase, partial [Candidatus Hydrogenedentes bacterium]|nr:sulfatase-like hydrolase/transferase [Candidatus Hydrogenedentota bacterium]
MPDVILISVDTLRADHLGMYGYERDTSPNLDRFARDAIVFEDMLCEIPLTSPSFASMMSSQFPRMTGTTRNGLPLPEDIPTAAKVFQAAGYQTV